jgi:NAD(P)-dependent dehydrogenase (short-subunit alcohol dehydrogenase family)
MTLRFRTIFALALAAGAGIALAGHRQRSRFSFAGRTVVITGGSRGLGLLLAREAAAQGARLALIARQDDTLQRAAEQLRALGAEVITRACDVSEQRQVNTAIAEIAAEMGSIDVLINNAGIIQVGPLEHMGPEDFERALAINFLGPLYTTLAALPHLQRAGQARLVNIASVGGMIAAPHLLPYTTSKFALVGLSDGLRAELRRHHIYVTTVCPGLMRTGSPPNADFKGQHRLEYAWFAMADSLPFFSVRGELAARQILDACRRGAPRLVVGWPAKGAVLFNSLCPGLSAWISSLIVRLLPGPTTSGSKAAFKGWESESWISRLLVNKKSEEATQENNEVPPSRLSGLLES